MSVLTDHSPTSLSVAVLDEAGGLEVPAGQKKRSGQIGSFAVRLSAGLGLLR
jgi:hypothetical protein